MRIIERLLKDIVITSYADVEEQYTAFSKGIRVLPAKYWCEKSVYFTFVSIVQPGVLKHLPTGGINVRNASGGQFAFELDQVIIHPSVINTRSKRAKIEAKAHKNALKIAKGGKRGRPALAPEVKAQRDAIKAAKPVGTGKRGRPKGVTNSGTAKVYVPTGGKRGRPALSSEAKASKVKTLVPGSSGKRGRPANPGKAEERARIAAERLAANPTKRRGRPSTKYTHQ